MLSRHFFDDPLYTMHKLEHKVEKELERDLKRTLRMVDDPELKHLIDTQRRELSRWRRYDPYFLSQPRGLSPWERSFLRDTPSYFDDIESRFFGNSPGFLSIREPQIPTLTNVDENSSVRLKYEVNDNGRIYRKTVSKEPGEEWKTTVEEYDTGKKAVKDTNEETKQLKEGTQEIKSGESQSQKTETPEKGQLTNPPSKSTPGKDD